MKFSNRVYSVLGLVALLAMLNVMYVFFFLDEMAPPSDENSSTVRQTRYGRSVCTQRFKKSHYVIIDALNGRTGNMLFQIFCLLAMADRNCYTVALGQGKRSENHLDSIFDLNPKHVQRVSIYDNSSQLIVSTYAHRYFDPQVMDRHDTTRNWTVIGLFKSYRYFIGQEDLIRSSVTFKKHITDEVRRFTDARFGGQETACIQVRRTDKLQDSALYGDFDWYKPYILRAMGYLTEKHGHVAFIFVSDDIDWCKRHFEGEGQNIFFSPFTDAGLDLALMSICDHTVLTVGTFGWMGAWFSQNGTVVYQADRAPKHYYANRDFFLPHWVGIH